jgi:hypothetical protein
LFVPGSRRVFPVDFTRNEHISHAKLKATDGSIDGQRKLIGHRQRFGVWIFELLLEHYSRETSARTNAKRSLTQRQNASIRADKPATITRRFSRGFTVRAKKFENGHRHVRCSLWMFGGSTQGASSL